MYAFGNKRTASCIAGVAAVFMVAGACTSSDSSTVRAELVWEDGAPPSGGIDDDPRAQAVREYLQWTGASRNALDFSELDDHTAPGTGHEMFLLAKIVLENGRFSFQPGPHSVEVLEIEDLGTTAALVHACLRASNIWRVEGLETDEPVVTEWSKGDDDLVAYDVQLIDGQWRTARPNDESFSSESTCDASNAPVATYVHQPDPELLTQVDRSMLIDHEGNRVGDD